MKRLRNGVACLSLAAFMFCSMPIVASASTTTTTKTGVHKTITVGKYKGTVVSNSEIPLGVTPIKVNSLKEAEQVVDKLNKDLENTLAKDKENKTNKAVEPKSNTSIVNNTLALASSSTESGVQTKKVDNISVKARYKYYTASPKKFASCTSVTSSLSGVHVGTSWTQSSYDASVIDGGRTLSVSISGVLDYWILSPAGPITFKSKDFDRSLEFYSSGI